MNTTQAPTTTTGITRRWYRHPAAIVVAGTAGSLLVIGASVAIALELTDDLWSSEYRSSSTPLLVPPAPVAPAPPIEGTLLSPDLGSTLEESIEAAVSAAGGVGATSIAIGGGRFEIDVLLADGREIEVYVGADGSASVDSVPYVDPSGDPALVVERIPSIVDASLAAVAASVGSGGVISELSSTNAPGRAFEITVLMPNGTVVYLELADDLTVVEIDLD